MRWVIGDIHGMFRPLEKLLAAIERKDPLRQLLFVGDYVNRGPDSKGVIDLLLSLKDAHFVRGNHDDVFDHVLHNVSYCGEPGEDFREASFKWFMQHGLDKTFMSYGVSEGELKNVLRRTTAAALDELTRQVPAGHRQFIRNLPAVIESADLFVAHAKWDVHTPTEKPTVAQRLASSEKLRYPLLWGRYRSDEIEADKPWARTGYFGHTPVDSYLESADLVPVTGPKIVLLDTAAALVPHGRLSAYCHETGQFIQVDQNGKLTVPP
jgi:serine/threonine protein phosphatase 1